MDVWRSYQRTVLNSLACLGVFLVAGTGHLRAGALAPGIVTRTAASVTHIGGHPFTPPDVPPPPPDSGPPPPTDTGGPPPGGNLQPPADTPEPAALTSALVGMAVASAAGWYRRRKLRNTDAAEV
jgi:hypothetical protein